MNKKHRLDPQSDFLNSADRISRIFAETTRTDLAPQAL